MNTAAAEFAYGFACEKSMPFLRIVRAYLMEARYETVRMLRAPAFAVPFLGLPAMLYLLFGVFLYGDALRNDPKGQLFLFMGFATFGVMGPGMFGFGVTVAMEREQGLLRLKRALPAPPAAYLLAKMLMSVLFVAIMMATMAIASSFGLLKLSGGQLLSVSAVNTLGALPFCAIGLFLGTWSTGKSAPAFVNLLYLPMTYLSGFLIPLPASVKWIASASPAFHLNQIAYSSVGVPIQGSVIAHVTILVIVTLVLTALAIRRLAKVG